MKRLAKWLDEHAIFPWGPGREGVVHLWSIVITIVAFLILGIFKIKGDAVVWVCAVIYLGTSVGLPILAGIIALIKRQKWNPWYWFPAVTGAVLGGLVGMLICWAFGIV